MSCNCSENNNIQTCVQNPCSSSATNTASCESLPSALENFITQFFGVVTKTEVNGKVTWTLPCDLETGLENNPRLPDEGLACYFKRLFEDGILGATGPTGPTGSNGANGSNAFTVTTQGFEQPTLASPSVTVRTAYNPSMLAGLIIFIATSGWYQIQSTATDGTLVLTLLEAVSGATGTISAGKLVLPAGPRGISVTGAVGPQGAKGDTGSAGVSHTESNAQVEGSGVDFGLGVTFARIVFGATEPEITLPDVGTYLIEIDMGVEMDTTAAAYPTPEEIELRLYNATTAAVVPNSSRAVSCFGPEEKGQITRKVIVTTASANNTIQLYAKVQTAGKANVLAAQTTLVYVKLA